MGNLLTSAEEDRTFNKEVENEKVVKIEKMSVPTHSAKGRFSHEGVKATTESGNVYMIHKVGKPNNDHESATAVHDWSTLRTDDWRSTGHTESVEDRNVKVMMTLSDLQEIHEGHDLIDHESIGSCMSLTYRLLLAPLNLPHSIVRI